MVGKRVAPSRSRHHRTKVGVGLPDAVCRLGTEAVGDGGVTGEGGGVADDSTAGA